MFLHVPVLFPIVIFLLNLADLGKNVCFDVSIEVTFILYTFILNINSLKPWVLIHSIKVISRYIKAYIILSISISLNHPSSHTIVSPRINRSQIWLHLRKSLECERIRFVARIADHPLARSRRSGEKIPKRSIVMQLCVH